MMAKIARTQLKQIIQEEIDQTLVEEGIFGKSKLEKEVEKVEADPTAFKVGEKVPAKQGKVSPSEVVDARMIAAGFKADSQYLKRVKKAVHDFFLDYLYDKKVSGTDVEVSPLKEYKFEKESAIQLLKSLLSIPSIGGEKAPRAVLNDLVRDVERQLTANKIIFDQAEEGSEAVEADPGAGEETEDDGGQEMPPEKESSLKPADLLGAINQLENFGKFKPKEFLADLKKYREAISLDDTIKAAYAPRAASGEGLEDEDRQVIDKIRDTFEKNIGPELDAAFKKVENYIKNLYQQAGRGATLNEDIDLDNITIELLTVIVEAKSADMKPKSLAESFKVRSANLNKRLMKRWIINS